MKTGTKGPGTGDWGLRDQGLGTKGLKGLKGLRDGGLRDLGTRDYGEEGAGG
jgi:hypothetical protein